MAKAPKYEWYENTGIAYCTLYYNNIEFKGSACCHDDDLDMMSKLTGQFIAEMRATLYLLRHVRDNVIKPKLAALNQLYYSMNRSQYYNPRGYEARSLYNQIQNHTNDLEAIKEAISNIQKELKEYIDTKEKSYQTIRLFREKAAKDN